MLFRAPHLGARGQKDLDGRVREDIGADVPSLHHHVGAGGKAWIFTDEIVIE